MQSSNINLFPPAHHPRSLSSYSYHQVRVRARSELHEGPEAHLRPEGHREAGGGLRKGPGADDEPGMGLWKKNKFC